MPNTGAPFNIQYPDENTPLDPLEDAFAALADSVADALNAFGVDYVVSNVAALSALSTAKPGDTAWMTTPGTGISPLKWKAYAGTGTGLDWSPLETVTAASVANLNSFIAVVAADVDTRFVIGARAFVTATLATYMFTTAVGAYIFQEYFAEATGLAATTANTGGGASAPFNWSNNYPIVFPAGRFTVPPIVLGAPSDNASGSILPGVQFTDITTSGCNFRVYRIGATPDVGTKVAWRATQATPTTAAG